MTLFCGIYGYECTQTTCIQNFELRPKYTSVLEAREKALDKSKYHLTAVIVGDSINAELAFRLEAILSFIEHLDVIVTVPSDINTLTPFEEFPATLPTHGRHDGGGATLMSDVFFENSRSKFIQACLTHLEDEALSSRTLFADLLFKKVETFRQRRPLIEVSYFLLYSGLEAHARAVTGNTKSNASEPITKLLTGYGFDVSIERPANLRRAMSTYGHIRNALFHTSHLETTINVNGQATSLKLLDYYANFMLLLSLVVFKAVQFEASYINWDSWIDRKQFK